MNKKTLLLFGIFLAAGLIASPARAEEPEGCQPSWLRTEAEPMGTSVALTRYMGRPRSEQSKLLFLVERLGPMDITVIYDDYGYPSKLLMAIAKIFLFQNYSGQTALEFVDQWGSRSIFTGALIKMKFPNGEERFARDVFLEELECLERAARGESVDAADPETVPARAEEGS